MQQTPTSMEPCCLKVETWLGRPGIWPHRQQVLEAHETHFGCLAVFPGGAGIRYASCPEASADVTVGR